MARAISQLRNLFPFFYKSVVHIIYGQRFFCSYESFARSDESSNRSGESFARSDESSSRSGESFVRSDGSSNGSGESFVRSRKILHYFSLFRQRTYVGR